MLQCLDDQVVLAQGPRESFLTGKKTGIQAIHARRLQIMLTLLNVVKAPQAMNPPGVGLHALKGDLKGHWAVTVKRELANDL